MRGREMHAWVREMHAWVREMHAWVREMHAWMSEMHAWVREVGPGCGWRRDCVTGHEHESGQHGSEAGELTGYVCVSHRLRTFLT